MGKSLTVNVHEIALNNLLAVMADVSFSKNLAAKIVGGEKRLEYLVATGEIEADKKAMSPNGKWFCNAAQVLRHCKKAPRKKI